MKQGKRMNGRRAVLVVVDSLRRDLITPEHTPALASLLGRGFHCAGHRSVFPSTTRTASASLATGCLPARHGLQGNVMALDEGSGLAALSTGRADFRDRLRALTGHVLRVPTLAERVAPLGGALIYSNASPGAAHVQDPDGHGHLFNRAGSHGPGLKPLPAARHLDVPKGNGGDRQTTERFIHEALEGSDAPLCVLWLSEPDHSGHVNALGGPEHLAAIRGADACVGGVLEALGRLDPEGANTLLGVTSDHGQETTGEVIHVDEALIEAGLKDGEHSRELVAASQGTSVLFYLTEEAQGRAPALRDFLVAQPWAGEAFFGEDLHSIGLGGAHGLAGALSLRKSARVNPYGVPGYSDIAYEAGGLNHPGCGQHGGTGAWEQSPFLVWLGGGFPASAVFQEPTTPMDVAPTIQAWLNLPAGTEAGQDGRPLAHLQPGG